MNLRAVRSFVRRAGRQTPAQQRALTELWPRYGVPGETGLIDFAVLFGRSAPNTIEIGFGNGDHLAARALAEPERNFLGVEVHLPGIGHLLRAAAAANLANLRVVEQDAVVLLHERIAVEALDEVQILFPDPWPKKRHHKRRLIQPDFAQLVASRLRHGGLLHVATDWEPYAQQISAVLDACPLLATAADARLVARAVTRFEQRGLRLGHG
ncbi:MAG: tRNA (guanosine(46)-N7)-methyltransferase TrmB, partial [Steroidobacteraceae bacterium]